MGVSTGATITAPLMMSALILDRKELKMRAGSLTVLAAGALALLAAAPAVAESALRLLRSPNKVQAATAPTCAEAKDAKHDEWIDLLSVGPALKRSANRGKNGHVDVFLRGTAASAVIDNGLSD